MTMKLASKCITLLLMVLSFAMSINAAEGFTENGLQKFYVQGENVKVANNGIFVLFEGDMLNVSSIYLDSQGAYIAGLGVCSVCRYPNDDMGRCQNPRCRNYGKG